jgi:hypothetical protein
LINEYKIKKLYISKKIPKKIKKLLNLFLEIIKNRVKYNINNTVKDIKKPKFVKILI